MYSRVELLFYSDTRVKNWRLKSVLTYRNDKCTLCMALYVEPIECYKKENEKFSSVVCNDVLMLYKSAVKYKGTR